MMLDNITQRLIAPGVVISMALLSMAHAQEPATPNALPQAQAVLRYLASLPARKDNRVVSGQQLGDALVGVEGYVSYVERLQQQTGKWVGMIGADYCYPDNVVPSTIQALNRILINYWKAGGLVTISIHPGNPWGGDVRNKSVGNYNDLITPGTSVNKAWMADLKMLADGLEELRNNGVVVLWRPLHEMNGGWFWWPSNAAEFKKVWNHLFDYFVNERQLNNLLWVFAPFVGRYPATFFPGSTRCDIVGLDYYGTDFSITADYNAMVALGKPFGLTEWGVHYMDGDGSYDNANLISRIRSTLPATSFFLTWSSWPGAKMAIVDNKNAAGLLDDSWVVTRDELPSFTNITTAAGIPVSRISMIAAVPGTAGFVDLRGRSRTGETRAARLPSVAVFRRHLTD